MPYTILLADDDDAVRKSHVYALEAASASLGDTYTIVESDNSVDAWAKIRKDRFDLIVLDNDFKDGHLKGRLPGIALLQLARKEGANTATPIVFCSAETFATLKPMVEKFSCVHLPKAGYDIDEAARVFAEQLKSKGKK
jgi:CheY-like chemotaxis protein